MLGIGEKKYKPEDIIAAHAKQLRKYNGEGGVIFTPDEQVVIDNHIPLQAAEETDNA